MEILSDNATAILNDLHTERLKYESEYVPLADAVNKLKSYEDTGLTPEEITELLNKTYGPLHITIARGLELAQAEKEERIVVLPVPLGAELWMIVEKRAKLSLPPFRFIKRTYLTWYNVARCTKYFGKTVFLTKEEAEAALKKMEG